MVLDKNSIRLLGLNTNEVKVLDAIKRGASTPVKISAHTKVSRPAIYEILERLHNRRLIKSNIVSGKKYWSQAKDRDLEQELYETKKALFDFEEGREETRGLSDSTVVVHRGPEAVQKILLGLTKEHSSERIYMLSGENMIDGWEEHFGVDKINEFNRLVKKNKLITELVMSEAWIEEQASRFGEKWIKDIEGRTAMAHKIPREYLDNAGQIFIFKNSLYLISMNEALVVEVRNSEIQKIILSVFSFVQDHAQKFDPNALLRTLAKESAD